MASPYSSSESYAAYTQTHSLPRKDPPSFIPLFPQPLDPLASSPQPFNPLASPGSDGSKTEKDPTSLPPIQVKESKRPVRLAIFSILLPTIAMFLVLLALLVVLVAYVSVINQATIVSTHILTTGKSTRVITISQIISKCVSNMIPMVMAIQAFSVAATWMKSSASEKVIDRPTPVHLGLAISNLGGPTMLNLWASIRYLFTFDSASRKQRKNKVSTPSFFKRTVALLFWTLLLDHLIGLADFALHITASQKKVPSTFDYANEGWVGDKMMLGRDLNSTKCEESRAADYALESASRSCGLENGSNNVAYLYLPQGTRILTNTSEENSIAYLEDNTAILTASELPEFSYNASSLGLRSSCKSITRDCVSCKQVTDEYTGETSNSCSGDQVAPKYNCIGEDNYDITQYAADGTFYTTQGLLDNSGNEISGSEVTTNPVNFGATVSSFVYAEYQNGTGVGQENFNGDTGFLVHGHYGGFNVLFCEIEAVRSYYRFDPPNQFTRRVELEQKLDSQTTAVLLWNAVAADRISLEVEGSGTLESSNETYADAYARSLSKYTLAMSSAALMPVGINGLNGAQQPGSQLSLIALVCYVLLVALFALTLLVSGLISFFSALRVSSPSLPAIHSLFLSPLPTLRQLHGRSSRENEALLSTNGVKLFAPEVEADRLSVATEWESGSQAWVIATRKN